MLNFIRPYLALFDPIPEYELHPELGPLVHIFDEDGALRHSLSFAIHLLFVVCCGPTAVAAFVILIVVLSSRFPNASNLADTSYVVLISIFLSQSWQPPPLVNYLF